MRSEENWKHMNETVEIDREREREKVSWKKNLHEIRLYPSYMAASTHVLNALKSLENSILLRSKTTKMCCVEIPFIACSENKKPSHQLQKISNELVNIMENSVVLSVTNTWTCILDVTNVSLTNSQFNQKTVVWSS